MGLDFFSYAIMKSVSVAGDTDTNACIAAGLVGAIVGINNIQPDMIGKVLSFDCTKDIIKRDKFLSVKYHAIPLIKQLI